MNGGIIVADYQDFKNSLLPGNYALTKSMELTKIRSSGTLWYTKKFLVLYYYIFLSSDIMTREYINKIIQLFDNYISSLDESVRDDAEKFFYPENNAINFKSESFKTFTSFAAYNDFDTDADRKKYLERAKKNYFALLVNSGGQTGVKKLMKEAIKTSDYVYSVESINKVLKNAAIKIAVEESNEFHQIKDNSVKYILSQTAINNIVNLSHIQKVSIDDAINIVHNYPMDNPNYHSVENDMAAFIRNERQIMYYYGYFHSKSSGANDIEFSSLTPVGEAALIANSVEFLAIWEHQKIKMISQPATADINNLLPSTNSAENFAVSYTPYTDILGYLLRNQTMSLDEYKYIVSRRKHTITEQEWQEIEPETKANLSEIKEFIASLNRQRDVKDEDGRKELLKYLLGLRSDLPLDKGINSLNVLKFKNSTVYCDNKETLQLLYNIYSKINDYKFKKYELLFLRCEEDLKRRYIETVSGNSVSINARTKIDWDLYNIHLDKFVLLGTILCLAASKYGLPSIEHLSAENTNNIIEYCCSNFSTILKCAGLRSPAVIRKDTIKFITAIRDSDYSYFTQTEENEHEVIAQYHTENIEDLFAKIKDISSRASVKNSDNRKRNTTLIDLLKSYYLKRYLENMTLKCECCNEDFFITEAGQPYMELHHWIPFKIAYGPDHYLNLFALCPNCHRKMHFINLDNKSEYYQKLNNNNYLHLTFVNRLLLFKAEKLLRSYHLEYLLADKAITDEEYDNVATS